MTGVPRDRQMRHIARAPESHNGHGTAQVAPVPPQQLRDVRHVGVGDRPHGALAVETTERLGPELRARMRRRGADRVLESDAFAPGDVGVPRDPRGTPPDLSAKTCGRRATRVWMQTTGGGRGRQGAAGGPVSSFISRPRRGLRPPGQNGAVRGQQRSPCGPVKDAPGNTWLWQQWTFVTPVEEVHSRT